MKVSFRISTEVSFAATLADDSTVEDLRNSAKSNCPPTSALPQDFKLIYNGARLGPPAALLAEFGMAGDVAVIVMSDGTATPEALPRLAPVAPKRKPKKRCLFQNCSLVPLRMVGDCAHCKGKFCAKHRLLENHLCTGLQFCKDSAHERNAMKLQSESTIASRV